MYPVPSYNNIKIIMYNGTCNLYFTINLIGAAGSVVIMYCFNQQCALLLRAFLKRINVLKNLICTKKRWGKWFICSGGEEGDVLFQLFVCCFNCGTVAIGENYREDDDDERLDDFEGGKASKPFWIFFLYDSSTQDFNANSNKIFDVYPSYVLFGLKCLANWCAMCTLMKNKTTSTTKG